MTSTMGRPVEYPDNQTIYQLEPKHYVAPKYTQPPNKEIHQRPRSQDEQAVGRDSLGSDCVPGMVEDHGSDMSADEYEYQGTELWDSFWQSRVNASASRVSPYPALLSSPATIRKAGQGQGQDLGMCPRTQLHQIHAANDQRNQYPMPLFGTTAERHRSRTLRPRPRASYSIFPPTSPPGPPRSSLSRPRTGSIATSSSQSSLDTQRPGTNITASPSRDPAAMPKSTRTVAQETIRAVTPTPGSPFVTFPSVPTESSRPSSRHKPLPELPPQARTANRRPSLASLRKLSLSKIATNSSSSIARLAHTQAHQAAISSSERAQHPLKEISLVDQSLRPLPPLPVEEREPVSAFDFDSDTESVKGDSQALGFVRRLMHGIAHPLRNHHRSSSDGRTSATSSRSRFRAETVGAEHNPAIEFARQDDGEDNSGNKPWLSRQSSEVFGRILGRWSA
ncbi:hypothetical protein B0T16DRAFT_19639 [Cercophora newfieldiana]|uniref:Uncharacterized protein n=1 Tax=Cercophora newfieldiana TaxID=92897 RepID=A0AA39YR38_9PEZI|nr:hypothetical protein B0T16DRAFT_19639 [Cercophora newfieldiana]